MGACGLHGGRLGKDWHGSCLWLIQNGVPPLHIRWIMPRHAWLLNRANLQPGVDYFERTIGSAVAQFEAITEATSISDLFARLEERNLLMRIRKAVEPTTYRCAVVSAGRIGRVAAHQRHRTARPCTRNRTDPDRNGPGLAAGRPRYPLRRLYCLRRCEPPQVPVFDVPYHLLRQRPAPTAPQRGSHRLYRESIPTTPGR